MMIGSRLATIAAAAALCGCGSVASAAALPSQRLTPPSTVVLPTATATPTPKPVPLPRVAIVLHGLNSTVATFEGTDPGRSLLAGLRAQGWRVVVPEEPYASNPPAIRADISRDGGVSYRARWDAQVARLLRQIGPAAEIAVVGISWGGLHAFMAACDFPEISLFVVHMPVVRAANLTEFRGLLLPGLDVTRCAPHLSRLHGQMSYGTIDYRVGVAPSVALGRAIASATVRVIPEHEDHSTTAADVRMMLTATT